MYFRICEYFFTITEIPIYTLALIGGINILNLGEKLKQLRLEKNLTQKQLADRLGVAISAISSYESDTRCPTFDTLIKYARIFHVSTDYLLGLEPIHTLDVSGLSDTEILVVAQLVDIIRTKK